MNMNTHMEILAQCSLLTILDLFKEVLTFIFGIGQLFIALYFEATILLYLCSLLVYIGYIALPMNI